MPASGQKPEVSVVTESVGNGRPSGLRRPFDVLDGPRRISAIRLFRRVGRNVHRTLHMLNHGSYDSRIAQFSA